MALCRRSMGLACELFRTKICLKVPLQKQERGTCVFRRMYPPKLQKKDAIVRPALKRREYVYILEEDTNRKPAGDLKVILTRDVEGLGFAGEEITVTKRIARYTLFPADLAVYATPENMKKTEPLRKLSARQVRKSVWAQKTIRALKHMNLPIPMNPKVSWRLNKTHIRVAFRNVGVVLEDECIILPEQPVTEPQNLQIKIIVNESESVMVNAVIYYYYSDLRDAPGGVLPDLPPVWQEEAKMSLEDIAAEYARKIGPAPPPIL